jgi:hypothetical protein
VLEILLGVVRFHPEPLNISEKASAFVLGLFCFQWQGLTSKASSRKFFT